MSAGEHLYVVTYDIREPKGWRQVYRTMRGFGEWLQLSVFQCRLTAARRVEMEAALPEAVNETEDHVVMVDLGPAEGVEVKVHSLGKTFTAVERHAVIA